MQCAGRVFYLVTAGTTAVAAVKGWPSRMKTRSAGLPVEFFNAVVCNGTTDFASAANVLPLPLRLLSAVCRESRPILATLTSPRLSDRGLELTAAVQ